LEASGRDSNGSLTSALRSTAGQPGAPTAPERAGPDRASMRLLYVIHSPLFGGAHNQALLLSRPLAERGIESTVVLPEDGGRAAERLEAGGVEALTIPLGRLRASPNPALQARFAARIRPDIARLRGLIRNRSIDLVQVHGSTNPQGALAARGEDGTAVVWQLYDTRAPMLLRRLAMPLVVRLADAITTWGEELARVHPGARHLGDRCITVFPPVDARRFAPDPARRASARSKLAITGEAPTVGALGVFIPHKGYEYFVRAAAIVAGERPDVRFRALAASSPVHASYERRVIDEARRLGVGDPARLAFIDPGTSVPELIEAFDAFVLTSPRRSEGMPTAVLEAMASGKAVVATDVGAVEELVDDGVTGFVVEPENPAAIARAVLRLIQDPELRRRMGDAGRERASEHFDLDRLADLHLHAYRTAIAHRRGRRAAR
jgi:glycosyltransferase involved in cell wall biosynthesis